MAAVVSESLWSKSSESLLKLSKILGTMKHNKKNFPDKEIFKKGSLSLFWFSPKQILDSENSGWSCHQLFVTFDFSNHFLT